MGPIIAVKDELFKTFRCTLLCAACALPPGAAVCHMCSATRSCCVQPVHGYQAQLNPLCAQCMAILRIGAGLSCPAWTPDFIVSTSI